MQWRRANKRSRSLPTRALPPLAPPPCVPLSPEPTMARMILLAAAAAALLAAAPAAAQQTTDAVGIALRPTEGALCGPNAAGVWMKAGKLAASGGAVAGPDGCITAADKTATAFVRASLGSATYTLFDVYLAAASSVSTQCGAGTGPRGLRWS